MWNMAFALRSSVEKDWWTSVSSNYKFEELHSPVPDRISDLRGYLGHCRWCTSLGQAEMTDRVPERVWDGALHDVFQVE